MLLLQKGDLQETLVEDILAVMLGTNKGATPRVSFDSPFGKIVIDITKVLTDAEAKTMEASGVKFVDLEKDKTTFGKILGETIGQYRELGRRLLAGAGLGERFDNSKLYYFEVRQLTDDFSAFDQKGVKWKVGGVVHFEFP